MTTKQTDGERLVRLEVKVENIEKLLVEMSPKLDDIRKEQNNARMRNVSREELDKELKALRDEELSAIMAEIKSSKQRNTLLVWVTGSLSAAFGILLYILINYYFQNIGG